MLAMPIKSCGTLGYCARSEVVEGKGFVYLSAFKYSILHAVSLQNAAN